MKIENVESYLVRIPFDHGAEKASLIGREWLSLDNVFIRIDTDAGISGWGDAFAYGAAEATKAAVDHMIAPALLGLDASDITGISDRLQRDNHIWGRYGVTMFAISGVDIALWDIAGKAAGKPLYELFGGARRQNIPGYASLFKYQDPDLVADKTRQSIDLGYRHVKLHETAYAEAAAARSAAGDDIDIMLDTNCPWLYDEALAMATQLRDLNLYWLEEPIFPPEDFASLAQLQSASGIPLAAGENACTSFEFTKMFDAGAVSYAQPSVTKVGGITEMLKIIELAENIGQTVVPHSPYFGPGFLASLHIAAAMRDETLIERFYLDLEAYPVGDMVDPVNGHFRLPEAPGLGADVDSGVLKDFGA